MQQYAMAMSVTNLPRRWYLSRRLARCMNIGIRCRPMQPNAQKRRHCVEYISAKSEVNGGLA